MDTEHESFFKQLEWVSDNKLKGMRKPGKMGDASIIFSKVLIYRGFSFRFLLYPVGGWGITHEPQQLSAFSRRVWAWINDRMNKENLWYSEHKSHTLKELVEWVLSDQLAYLDWILYSTPENFDCAGKEIAKKLIDVQKKVRALSKLKPMQVKQFENH